MYLNIFHIPKQEQISRKITLTFEFPLHIYKNMLLEYMA